METLASKSLKRKTDFNGEIISNKRPKFELEIENFMLKSRNNRTLIYSGSKKNADPVENVKFNIHNIFTLGEIDKVPFITLRPVLEKLSPSRLTSLEKKHPHLLKDTDCLWQLHIRKEFKNAIILDNTSFRDMYLKLTLEREKKLDIIKQKVAASKAKIIEDRKAKLLNLEYISTHHVMGTKAKTLRRNSPKIFRR